VCTHANSWLSQVNSVSHVTCICQQHFAAPPPPRNAHTSHQLRYCANKQRQTRAFLPKDITHEGLPLTVPACFIVLDSLVAHLAGPMCCPLSFSHSLLNTCCGLGSCRQLMLANWLPALRASSRSPASTSLTNAVLPVPGTPHMYRMPPSVGWLVYQVAREQVEQAERRVYRTNYHTSG
jgi:hypothetical protein